MSSKHILQPVPQSPWMNRIVNDMSLWVHIPSRRCGIHIRSLAKLCGVAHTTILGILQNAAKDKGNLVGLRERDLYNSIKNKTIFLENLVGPSPDLKGGPVKVVWLDVCMIFIRHYANVFVYLR